MQFDKFKSNEIEVKLQVNVLKESVTRKCYLGNFITYSNYSSSNHLTTETGTVKIMKLWLCPMCFAHDMSATSFSYFSLQI
jgi:hypothetical protein